jgi:hypothetical protein
MKTTLWWFNVKSQPNHKKSSAQSMQQTKPKGTRRVGNWIGTVGRSLKKHLKFGTEVHICTYCDRHGRTWWKIYDPFTGKIFQMESEEAVLQWLEQTN